MNTGAGQFSSSEAGITNDEMSRVRVIVSRLGGHCVAKALWVMNIIVCEIVLAVSACVVPEEKDSVTIKL
jgi:hypothetical protein